MRHPRVTRERRLCTEQGDCPDDELSTGTDVTPFTGRQHGAVPAHKACVGAPERIPPCANCF
ncbi:hypothetical protein GCM10009749_33260 [Agromyces neolithicus]|uniref:Uncharacterized protein n=1 Tax=Agromyces neolithicus TaxID=269420 RepID=A0ABN2MCN7_9MICO